MRALLDRTGAIEHARAVARGLAGAAVCEFDAFFARVPVGRDLSFMRNLLTWVLQRVH